MNVTEVQLELQYEVARKYAADLIDATEKEFNLPPFSMYAIGSRETNFNPYYINHAGDGGHGRGWWQVDDRSHHIPDNWDKDINWQCQTGAAIFYDCLQAANQDLISAFNRYNSGQGKTQYTTGKDYGPDTEERRQYLFMKYNIAPTVIDSWDDLFVPLLCQT